MTVTKDGERPEDKRLKADGRARTRVQRRRRLEAELLAHRGADLLLVRLGVVAQQFLKRRTSCQRRACHDGACCWLTQASMLAPDSTFGSASMLRTAGETVSQGCSGGARSPTHR